MATLKKTSPVSNLALLTALRAQREASQAAQDALRSMLQEGLTEMHESLDEINEHGDKLAEAGSSLAEVVLRVKNLGLTTEHLHGLRTAQNRQMDKMVQVLESLSRSVQQIESNIVEPVPGMYSFAVFMDRLKGVEERIDKLERQDGVVVAEVFAAAAKVVELTRHGLAIGETNEAVRRLRRALESVPKLQI